MLILACFTATPCFSQQLHFQRYGIKDGFVHSGTGSREVIIQDKEGFLWFSTHHGISRFDGREFKNFRYDPLNSNSIGNNLTVGIVEADDGKIWVGTADEGLFIFDPVTEAFEQVSDELTDLCGHGMNTLNKDQDGNIWIGTRFNGFCRWVKEKGQFESIGQLREGHHFYQQKEGTVWLGDWNGIHKVESDGVLEYITYPPDVPDYWQYKVVQDQVELPDGQFLLTSSFEGFWIFDPTANFFKDLTNDFKFKNTKVPYSFLADEKGKIWIGADGELWLWDSKDRSKTIYLNDDKNPNSVPATMIPCIYKDNAGSLWLITKGDGIAVAHDLDNPFEVIGKMPFVQMIPMKENIVVAWTKEGIYHFNSKTKMLTPINVDIGPMRGLRRRMLRYSEEEIIFSDGNISAAKIYNISTGSISVFPKDRLSNKSEIALRILLGDLHYLDQEENKWVGLYSELQQKIPNFISSRDFFQDLIQDGKNTIWISTSGGIFHYNLETEQGKAYLHDPKDPHSIPSAVCQLLYKGKDRRMYVSTTNGLAIYNPEEDHFDNYNEQNGLLHNAVNTVVEDDNGNLWIGTALGLQRLDLKTGTFTNYNRADGLPDDHIVEQFSCRDEEGWLYFFTVDEGFRFHPDSLPVRDHTAPAYLLDFYQNHELVTVGREDSLLQKMLRYTSSLTLPFDKNDFGFSFTMPVFYKPEETNYFYRLSPYQTKWQSAGNKRETHYTNIDPGTYTFQVKAQTANGTWCTKEASIEIIVLPPWYQTWWARTLFGLFIGGTLYLLYRQNLRRALEKTESHRLKELNALKTRLYTNITHEFRTPLTVIMGMTDNIRGHQNEKRLISRNSKNLLRLVNQLLDLSKLDSGSMKMDMVQGDIINYLQYLTESFYSMAHEKKVRLVFYKEIEEMFMDFDEVKIQHIVYNLLSNAIKFTPAGGKIVLHASQTQRNGQPFLKLKAKDTGIGISEEQLQNIFNRFYQADNSTTRKGEGTGIGLSLTKELVELMGGSIEVKSEVGKGTTFMLLLPIQVATDTPLPETEFVSSRSLAPELVPDLLETDIAPVPSNLPNGLNGEKPVLLIVEDNADVAVYITSLLEKDYKIHHAVDGQKGIDQAFELIPDIIISDVMMPEKDGYEVCEILKNDQRTSHIPIVLLTAKAEEADKVEGLRKGADAYLMKPFNKEELSIRLEKLLELRRSLRERYGMVVKTVDSTSSTANSQPTLEDIFLQKIQKVINEKMGDTDLAVLHLCRAVQLSHTQVFRKLKALTGENPTNYIRKMRLQKAVSFLKTTDLNISEIAYEVGFSDPNYFSRAFHEEFGMSPSAMRK